MLNGKTALVTGASRGIGKEIALCLADKGADIALVASHNSDEAKEALNEVTSLGVKGVFYECNIADAESVKMTSVSVLNDFGHIDILVNNAGITNDKLMLQMKEDDFSSVIDVNLTGTFNMSQAFLRQFVKQRYGRIINISSVVGLMGNAGQVNYAASKAGIIGLTKSMAKEYASKGITVNAVCPGYIETNMTGALSEVETDKIMQNIPVKRAGTPKDVANLVSFLAKEESSYITGEVIKVDGGMYI